MSDWPGKLLLKCSCLRNLPSPWRPSTSRKKALFQTDCFSHVILSFTFVVVSKKISLYKEHNSDVNLEKISKNRTLRKSYCSNIILTTSFILYLACQPSLSLALLASPTLTNKSVGRINSEFCFTYF
jgi:hypothetical protein